MSRRLNVELTDGEKILCACCWHEAAYTTEALDVTEAIVKTYDDLFGGSGADLYMAVKLLEAMGGGITGVERQRLKKTGCRDRTAGGSDTALTERDIQPASSVYNGIIAISNEGIREARRWENGRVRIDLTGRKIDFHAHYYTYLEEYVEFCDRVPGCTPWDELPQVNAGADIFTGIYFDHIAMIRQVVERFPQGFRLGNGDVIEWM